MAWRWHRSVRLGAGVRLNLSGRGWGISAGFPGYRRGIDAAGRSYRVLSVPGTGLSNRTYGKMAARTHPVARVVLVVLFLVFLKACMEAAK